MIEPRPVPNQPPKSGTSPKRILVVEDDPVLARKIFLALAVEGHSLDIAQFGEKGLAMFKAGQYDLVITDFKLAKMDGLELAEAIKYRKPNQPIILITAYVNEIDSRIKEVSNVDVLLRKPISVNDLEQAMTKIFSGSPTSAASQPRAGVSERPNMGAVAAEVTASLRPELRSVLEALGSKRNR